MSTGEHPSPYAIAAAEMKKLRNMDVYKSAVSDINYVAIVPGVQLALNRWIASKNSDVAPGVLIGDLAMSFYAAPRVTMDIDLLFLSKKDIPKTVKGFQKQGPSAFLEIKNNIVVDVKTPEAFNGLVPPKIAQQVVLTAVNHGGIFVASREGMMALKLLFVTEYSPTHTRYLYTRCNHLRNHLGQRRQ